MNQIDSLVATLSLTEKIGQLTMVTAGYAVTGPVAPPDLRAAVAEGRAGSVLNLWGSPETQELQTIARAGPHAIPIFFGLDVVHGFRTIFPIPLAEACAFDDELWWRTAHAAATEAAQAGIHLTFAPMIDIARDPRWGRIAEGPGEDPVLGGRFAAAKTHGFQGGSLVTDGIAATAKHFVAYGAAQAGREYASAEISDRALYEVYLPPFRASVAAGIAAVMPSFNDIAGVPASASVKLLRGILRDQWGFDGVVISDYNAITELLKHGIASDIADAAALALKAGIDIDMMGFAYERGLPLALEREPALIEHIDAAVRRVLVLKQKLGLFEDGRHADSPARVAPRVLAREAAERSIVLLTNRGVLPLDPATGKIAVIGPLADARGEMLGPWAAAGRGEDAISILEGLKAAFPHASISFAKGVDIEGGDTSGIAGAVSLAHAADVVILCVGEAAAMSGEAASRSDLSLPGHQAELARAIISTNKPVIAVLSSGRPLIAPWLMESAHAVLATWFLGSEAGHAIAGIIADRTRPSAKLPVSWPKSAGQIPIFHAERPTGRPRNPDDKYTSKYLDTTNEPQFVFGHGLTYTEFAYSALRVRSPASRIGEPVIVSVDVTNTGSRAAEEIVLVFVHDLVASIAQPPLSFKASARVTLAPGESKTVTLQLPPDAFGFVGADLKPVIEPGEFEILVGPKADRTTLLTARLTLVAKPAHPAPK